MTDKAFITMNIFNTGLLLLLVTFTWPSLAAPIVLDKIAAIVDNEIIMVSELESRKTAIFRIRNKTRQPNFVSDGYTDHPDRGLLGEWLDLGLDENPWERSKDGICDMWADWSGMQKLVASVNL